ncbi:hypothetical protein [Roseibium sp. RKSG952]|uniref:hypothetical protein n=1 Tax=Roseibium sp. RKSG952 TaxID=2529384 RepID=UPI0012BBD60D|nr:hypothetical protein [Roseibium sp. RKSG952]MTH96143.1 hypothetical protein [Roseibium sp. RKSG952]
MSDLDVINHHGAVVDLRTRKMWRWLDPLGLGHRERYDFEYEIAFAVQTYSRACVEVGGNELKEVGEIYDLYGLGTSADGVLEDYVKGLRRDFGEAPVDILIKTRVEREACLFSDERPFYSGSVSIVHIPRSWVFVEEDFGDFELERTEFTVWKNGEATADVEVLRNFLKKCAEGDVFGTRRNGELRHAGPDDILGW